MRAGQTFMHSAAFKLLPQLLLLVQVSFWPSVQGAGESCACSSTCGSRSIGNSDLRISSPSLHFSPLRPLRGGFGHGQGGCLVGVPNEWSGRNIGPLQRKVNYYHSKLKPANKAMVKWFVDCSRPVADKVLDVADLERFLREHIKVKGKTGHLAPRREGSQPFVSIRTDKKNRIMVQAFIPLSKQYLKYLCKIYLQKTGTRDFIWCVASGKSTYQLRYYNFEEIKTTARASSFQQDDNSDVIQAGDQEAREEAEEAAELIETAAAAEDPAAEQDAPPAEPAE